MKRMGFNIDVVSACNLKCPSCPVGNSEDVTRSKGIMASELLEEILKKAPESAEANLYLARIQKDKWEFKEF